MLKFLFRISFVSILFFGLTTACTEDSPIGGGTTRPIEEEPIGPSVGLVADVDVLSDATTIPVGSSFTVRLSAQAGEAALRTVTILENGSVLDFSRIQYSDASVGANPTLILDAGLQTGFTWDITIMAPESAENIAYSFEVEDENDKVDVVFLSITTQDAPAVAPTSSVVEEPPFFWGSKTCGPNERFEMRILAEGGSSLIQSVTVLEDGLPIQDLSRLQANSTEFPANPWAFSEGQTSLDWVVGIRTSDDGNDHVYTIVTTDENGLESTVSIDVFAAPTGTSISNSLEGRLLLNQAGPAGTGGINLFTGESVGSSAAEAHIRDEGIDIEKTNDVNWNQQISGVNGSIIRTLGNQPETFNFDNIQFTEEIVSLFETGDDLIVQNGAGRFLTPFVLVGDVFVVQNGGNYFLLEVTNVNVTANDNNDFYEFSIKY